MNFRNSIWVLNNDDIRQFIIKLYYLKWRCIYYIAFCVSKGTGTFDTNFAKRDRSLLFFEKNNKKMNFLVDMRNIPW